MQAATAERRKNPRKRSFLHQEPVCIQPLSSGNTQAITIKVKDVSDTGLGCEAATPLAPGSAVLISGVISKGLTHKKLDRASAKVTYCKDLPSKQYAIGLEFDSVSSSAPPPKASAESLPDYYDTLQLSSKADPDTIHRVYRLLAQRYHPDNKDTGDQDLFKQVLEAYGVLSDPQKRASYDATFTAARQLRWKIFDQANATQGREGEKRKRAGVLSVLYTQRLNEPAHPGVTIHEFEELLGCPREHLEFTLWYLKESGCITRTDNGRYAITVKGVDTSESLEAIAPIPNNRLLAAAAR